MLPIRTLRIELARIKDDVVAAGERFRVDRLCCFRCLRTRMDANAREICIHSLLEGALKRLVQLFSAIAEHVENRLRDLVPGGVSSLKRPLNLMFAFRLEISDTA
ncbi:hypothetical protein C446_09950 [Halobiforma nitratireducens JCM 10879]|uniref:Uncharacterized protein n=1 Tax=Halobiforma nitratireducens JCM 10879 TaxID=1227454 RepID=M0M1T6_9EURY|nr:hypothetical protein C446_09950 [Halobiforma nitratireducens JCM 10879]